MQLTQYTDYSYRVLIYLAVKEESATIPEIAEQYNISRNHLVKVVHRLGQVGLVETQRGRNGGIKLKQAPENIHLGEVALLMEPNFNIVECFNREQNQCVITPVCQLKTVLGEATQAFMGILNRYTLRDMITDPSLYQSYFPNPIAQTSD